MKRPSGRFLFFLAPGYGEDVSTPPVVRKKRKKGKGPKPGFKGVWLRLSPAQWNLIEKLRVIFDERLKSTGRSKASRSTVVAALVADALALNGDDIQAEHAELGLHGLSVQLAEHFGADGIAAAGLPAVDPGALAGYRRRPVRVPLI